MITSSSTPDGNTVEQIIQRFSDYRKLLRVIGYCFRFIRNLQGKKVYGYLQLTEEKYAESKVISSVQNLHFTRTSRELQSLNPFYNDSNVLRVGGRLTNSFLTFEEKHPAVIQYHKHLALLIVRDAHENSIHGHNNLTEAIVRKRFWIIKAVRLI